LLRYQRRHCVGDKHDAEEEGDDGHHLQDQHHPFHKHAAPMFIRLLVNGNGDVVTQVAEAGANVAGDLFRVFAAVRFDLHQQLVVPVGGNPEAGQSVRIGEEVRLSAEGGRLHKGVTQRAVDGERPVAVWQLKITSSPRLRSKNWLESRSMPICKSSGQAPVCKVMKS
jgi:hypothetical protein